MSEPFAPPPYQPPPALYGEAEPPAAPAPTIAIGPLLGFALTAAALVVYSLLQAAVMVALVAWRVASTGAAVQDAQAILLAHLGWTFAIATVASAPPACAAVALALYLVARRQGVEPAAAVARHLGLRLPRPLSLLAWSAATAAFVYAFGIVSAYFERPPLPDFMVDFHATAGSVWLLAAAVVVAAPLVEEVLFRGLLLPSFTAGRNARILGLVVSATAWAAIHAQYDLFDVSAIFALGLLLGAARLQSGSLWTPILLHAGFNLTALVQLLQALGPVP